MINFIQSNQNVDNNSLNIMDSEIWEELLNKIQSKEKLNNLTNYIHNISISYNIDKKNIIKDFLNYIIKNHPTFVNNKLLDFVENVMHSQTQNINVHVNYSMSHLLSLLSI